MNPNNLTVAQYYIDNADLKAYYISSNHNLAETPITSNKQATFKCKNCNKLFKRSFRNYIIESKQQCNSCLEYIKPLSKHKLSLHSWFESKANSFNPTSPYEVHHIHSWYTLPLCEKNLLELNCNSKERVWFMCNRGHKFKQSPYNIRNHRKWCPICSNNRIISLPELYIYCTFEYLGIEQQRECKYNPKRTYDLYIESRKTAIEFDGEEWHTNLEHDLEKDELAKKEGITLIRIKEASTKENRLKISQFINEHSDIIKNNWIPIPVKVKSIKDIIGAINIVATKLNVKPNYTTDLLEDRLMIDYLLGIKSDNLLKYLESHNIQDEFNYKSNPIRPEQISKSERLFKIKMICHKCGNQYEATPYDITKNKLCTCQS